MSWGLPSDPPVEWSEPEPEEPEPCPFCWQDPGCCAEDCIENRVEEP